MSKTLSDLADQLLALNNSSPRLPTKAEIEQVVQAWLFQRLTGPLDKSLDNPDLGKTKGGTCRFCSGSLAWPNQVDTRARMLEVAGNRSKVTVALGNLKRERCPGLKNGIHVWHDDHYRAAKEPYGSIMHYPQRCRCGATRISS